MIMLVHYVRFLGFKNLLQWIFPQMQFYKKKTNLKITSLPNPQFPNHKHTQRKLIPNW